jgi:hypothetical protein
VSEGGAGVNGGRVGWGVVGVKWCGEGRGVGGRYAGSCPGRGTGTVGPVTGLPSASAV